MIKFLYSWFSWVPVLGGIFKAAYIGSLVKTILNAANDRPLPDDLKNKTGAELDEALAHEANALITEVIAPLDLGMVADIVRRTAVDKVVEALRAKVIPT